MRKLIDMVDKRSLTINLNLAEDLFEQVNIQWEQKIQKLRNNHADFVNMVKELNPILGEIISERDKEKTHTHFFGEKTSLRVDGVYLYTGDEIEFVGTDFVGKLGVVIVEGSRILVLTNKESLELNSENNIEHYIKIKKHFFEHKHMDIIALGRSGGEGFIIELKY